MSYDSAVILALFAFIIRHFLTNERVHLFYDFNSEDVTQTVLILLHASFSNLLRKFYQYVHGDVINV